MMKKSGHSKYIAYQSNAFMLSQIALRESKNVNMEWSEIIGG